MLGMELSLGEGWTQVEPRQTPYELLFSDQSPGQRLVASDTAFSRQRDLGYSGGTVCPIAVDEDGDRVFVSANGIVEIGIRKNEPSERKITDAVPPVWMLEYVASGPALLMRIDGFPRRQNFIARLDLETGNLREELLPPEAFYPLDVNTRQNKFLFCTRFGAAVYELRDSLQTVATVDLRGQANGGAFDADDKRVVLGGAGLHGWNTETGEVVRLCRQGSQPVFDRDGQVWFSLEDGALARLRGHEPGFEIIVELTGMQTSSARGGGYAQPMVFSPDGRFGLARLTGKTDLSATELEKQEAFCKHVGQPFSDSFRYEYHHYFCVLDLEVQEVWCHPGYAHEVAWVKGQ